MVYPNPNILFTVDVEDWFQVENFKEQIPYSSWSTCKLRVETNVHRLLDIMDSKVRTKTSPYQLKATFFVLGWIAQRLPNLVREIYTRGHEIASHGFYHKLSSKESYSNLKKDLIESKNILEDIIGAQVLGYRAPCFSISDDILKLIEDCSYYYDSSYNSFSMNERYGNVSLFDQERNGIAYKVSETLWELPISNLTVGKHTFPIGGGGYFRFVPFFIFQRSIKLILRQARTYVFYIHPWEIDPKQPKVSGARLSHKFRHYLNLKNTLSKLDRFLKEFRTCHFITCRDYLKQITNQSLFNSTEQQLRLLGNDRGIELKNDRKNM